MLAPRSLSCERASALRAVHSSLTHRAPRWPDRFRATDLPSFDGRAHPRFTRGVSPVPGLYFLGLPWLHTWGSGRFLGVAKDARHLVDVIAARRHDNQDAKPVPAVSVATA
jgi:putative flavoprotein involved in K+ transport